MKFGENSLNVYFQSIGVLTTYNLPLTRALKESGVSLSIDASNPLLTYYIMRTKYPNLLSLLGTLGRLWGSYSLYKKAISGYDILHLNEFDGLTHKILRKSNTPKIMVLHQAPFSEEEHSKIFAGSDKVVAPSEFTANNAEKKCGFKPLVIHHGVDTQTFNPYLSKTEARKNIGVPRNSDIVLWNDRLAPDKDVGTLLDSIPLVLKERPETYFLIKARSPVPEYIRGNNPISVKQKTSESNLDIQFVNPIGKKWKLVDDLKKNVETRLRWISQKKLANFYRASDLFVRTSLYENLGLASLESMACGTPVVGSECTTFPEVLGDAGSYFRPGDSEDLAQTILSLLESPERREVLAKVGIKRVKEKFTWERVAKDYLSLYEDLMANRNSK